MEKTFWLSAGAAPPPFLPGPVDPVVDQLREFARVIRDGVTPEVGGEEGLEVVAVLEAAVASAEQGRAVEVAEYRR
jgi:predicted dehydrogenase